MEPWSRYGGEGFCMHLELNESEYRVTADGISIELLPKEFMLLQFLNRNQERTFSREQLLDKVWPLEYPVERTVDDHIYRLRKKLASLQGLHIKTVRGYGYSLSMQDSTAMKIVNPTTKDAELHDTMRELFGKYHLYGQGRSMLTLSRQQDILGYTMDPFYSVCIHFVQGDLEWLLNTREAEMPERLYFLLLFYIFTGEPKLKLAFCEQVLEKNILPMPQHKELEILNILDLYVLAGEPHKALERLKLTHKVIAEPDFVDFIPATSITEMFVHIVAGTADEELEQMAEGIAELLLAKPFLREIGSYHVVKGLWYLRRKAWKEAERLLDEGLQVLDRSGFVPMRLCALHRIVCYCNNVPGKDSLRRKYIRILEEEMEELGLNRLLQPLETTLLNVLKAL